MTNTPFYEMFDCCRDEGWLRELLETAFVLEVVIDRTRLHMDVALLLKTALPPVGQTRIESELAAEYGLKSVDVVSQGRGETANGNGNGDKPPAPGKKNGKIDSGEVLHGRAIRGKITAMEKIHSESGKVAVSGKVFDTDHEFYAKRNAWRLDFCVTDHTGSLRISNFFWDAKLGETLCNSIKKGMTLQVRGEIKIDQFKYKGDIFLEPIDIVIGMETKRLDSGDGSDSGSGDENAAPAKRVELHLHTRLSAEDALTDIDAAVKQAKDWGHPAIAITDHGVVQGFPAAYAAGKRHGIQVILGLEGYFVNDWDDRLAVTNPRDWGFGEEFVAFDVETTGLSAERDEIIEFGAVRFKNGEIIDTFQSFVNPKRPIPPQSTQIHGIRDSDVKTAPTLDVILPQFLEFIGDCPLLAHNAAFDMGMLDVACTKCGITHSTTSIDTLTLAQALLPNLKRHGLGVVADFLGLPNFRHHRAADDATAVMHMFLNFIPRLAELGTDNAAQINDVIRPLRGQARQRGRAGHIILLVQNQTGLRNLYEMVSRSHLDHFYHTPRIPKSLLLKHREGLLIGSACERGEIYDAVRYGTSWSELCRLAEFYDYLEIQPLCNNQFLIDSGKVDSVETLKEHNRTIVRLGETLGKPVVATGDVHFLHPEDEIYRQVLKAKRFADADRPLPLYFKTTDEMLAEFSYLGEDAARQVVIENPQKIAALCETVPPFPDSLHSPHVENAEEDLTRLVNDKLHSLYGANPPDAVAARAQVELHDIIGRGYAAIYMIAQKLVAKSMESGYLVGSRGSVGSSIVAFLAGITEVNPLPAHYLCPACQQSDFTAGDGGGCGLDMPDAVCPSCGTAYRKDGFDIPFATFLGFGGDKVPDIDLNFSGEYQTQAHKEVENLLGADYVFRAGTVSSLEKKTAWGLYVKPYLEAREAQGAVQSRVEQNRLVSGIVGVKRGTGQHPGGLIVVPQDMHVSDFFPVQHPANKKESGVITAHFDYHSMEDTLLKLDLLGKKDPTMIKHLESITGVNAMDIPLDDPETLQLFHSPASLGLDDDDPIIGKTGAIAIPEFGTRNTRGILQEIQPERIDDLVRISGFSHGEGVWQGNAQDLIASGKIAVSEAIGCRDDIMLFLIAKGLDEKTAFAIMESVRKGRGLRDEWVKAMQKADVPAWYITSCQTIEYLFPKAHAAAYVLMGIRIAWFKVHHPAAFYSTYFTINAAAFDAAILCGGLDKIRAKIAEISALHRPSAKEKELLTMLEVCYEMHRRGITFAPIDLYRSAATRFQIDGDTLIPPFVAVAGLGDAAAEDIVTNRQGREFISIEEFKQACKKVSTAHIEHLKKLGTFAQLPDTSQVTLF